MGLLDTLGGKLNKNMADPLRMGLLAYGMTGQGQDPGGTAINTMMTAAKTKAETERKAAQMAQITGAFASGSIDPALLAQYSASGGEGSKEMLDLYKFGRTPQSVAPGQMMIDPTTGKMSMPAPKMGEGQLWDGNGVSEAQGYGNVMQQAINRDLSKYQQQEGIGYGYDVGRIGQQTQADIAKQQAKGAMDYGYDTNKMGVANEIAKGQEAFKAGLGAQGDVMTVTNPDGSQSYTSRADVLRGGGMAARSPEQAAYKAERSKANAAAYQGALDAAQKADTQLANIDRMAGLFAEVGDGTGKGEQALMGLNSLANQIGFNFDPKQGAKESIVAITNQMALGMKTPGSGTTSDKDMDVFLATVPNIAGTPEGNAKIMDTMAVFAQRKQKEADLMQRYAAGNSGVFDDAGEAALNKWRQSHPIKW